MKKAHFIGIGGIGISALARYYLQDGWRVSGSDLVASEITQALEREGIKIYIGPHDQKNLCLKTKMVIYSPAVGLDNPELKRAKKMRIKCQSYPKALGALTKKYFTIAVCGTHGKSTTTAMLSLVFIEGGLDPTVIVGTKLREFGNTNFRRGTSKFLIIEADEHMASFLNYRPQAIILTTLEPDHLDYYKNFKNYRNAFRKFISYLSRSGVLVINEKIATKKEKNVKYKTYKYSLKQPEAGQIKKILKIPGEHNILNALAVLTLSRAIKIPDRISFKALAKYKGAWRRMEEKKIKINNHETILVSDYGHHPTEISATVGAIIEKYPKKKIWLVFQPHQHQRTYYLFKDFVMALKNLLIERIILAPIYDVAGREEKKIKRAVSSKMLAKRISQSGKKVMHFESAEEIKIFLEKKFRGDILIIMGAGDIYLLGKSFDA